jgi:tRNA (adenine37-N6)-methyltransferase
MEINLKAIGVIQTPFSHLDAGMPIQSIRSDTAGSIDVFPEYLAGLEGVEDFSHLILIYSFHLAPVETSLRVKPFLDDRLHGVFATRFPNRPNHLGLSVVRLVSRHENRIEFLGADMLDGTPLLDIKPYVPDFDVFTATKIGWYTDRAHR